MANVPTRIAQLRAKIETTKAAIAALTSGEIPLPVDVVDAKVDAFVDRLVQNGLRWLDLETHDLLFDERGSGIVLVPTVHNGMGVDFERMVALLTLANTDAIRALIRASVRRHFDACPPPMSPDERTAKLAELRTRLLELEVAEYRAVEDASAGGLNIDHRADVDPAVLLGLAV